MRCNCVGVTNASAIGCKVRRKHQHDIVDPPSMIKLLQEHSSEVTPLDTMGLIRMQEAVALLI